MVMVTGLFWFFFDLYGALTGQQPVAYWAHIGGLMGGVSTGLVFLQKGWVRLTEYDNKSLLELLRGDEPER